MDDECIIEPKEYPGILTSPQSVMAFSRAHIGNITALEQAIANEDFVIIPRQIPDATLWKIIDCARNSRQLSDAKKRLLPVKAH